MNFDEELHNISEKMSDLVMEYAARFIAQDYFDAYGRAQDDDRAEFVPAAFDDKMYKKTSRQIRGKKGVGFRFFRICLLVAAATALALYVASVIW